MKIVTETPQTGGNPIHVTALGALQALADEEIASFDVPDREAPRLFVASNRGFYDYRMPAIPDAPTSAGREDLPRTIEGVFTPWVDVQGAQVMTTGDGLPDWSITRPARYRFCLGNPKVELPCPDDSWRQPAWVELVRACLDQLAPKPPTQPVS